MVGLAALIRSTVKTVATEIQSPHPTEIKSICVAFYACVRTPVMSTFFTNQEVVFRAGK